jgi:hypothetical protein
MGQSPHFGRDLHRGASLIAVGASIDASSAKS